MATTVPLGVLLLALSPPAPLGFGDRLEHTDLISGEGDVQLVAYDHEGEVVGTVVLWTDPDGTIWMTSDYGDGFAQMMIAPDGEVHTEATLPPDVIADRAERMLAAFPVGPEVQEGKFSCALSLAGTIVSCAAASWFCPITGISTACNCLPLIVEEWKDKKCPGFG